MPNGDLQVDFRDQDVADTVRVLRVPAALFADVRNRCAVSELKCLSLASVVYNYLGSLRTSDKSNSSDPRLVLSKYMASHRTVFRFCCCHPSCALRKLLLSTCMRYISSSRILAPVANILLLDSIHMPPHFFFTWTLCIPAIERTLSVLTSICIYPNTSPYAPTHLYQQHTLLDCIVIPRQSVV